MSRLQGLLGLLVIYALVFAISRNRRRISWRTLGLGLLLQVAFALLVLRWAPGRHGLDSAARQVAKLVGYTNSGSTFLFGRLLQGQGTVFVLNVLPVIIFLGALIGLLYYLRVIQWFVEIVGGAISRLLGTSKVESVWAATVIFLGQSEAPLLIAPYLKGLTRSELFTVMTGGFASVAGSTLVGYALLGAPLKYLLAASLMNAPASLVIAKGIFPETELTAVQASVRHVRDQESVNAIDATARGAINGGRLAVIVGCLLLAFISLIALANGLVGGVGGWFGVHGLTFQKLLGWAFAPVAWLIGVPWKEASIAGGYLGQKTVLNEFVAFSSFGPKIAMLQPTSSGCSLYSRAASPTSPTLQSSASSAPESVRLLHCDLCPASGCCLEVAQFAVPPLLRPEGAELSALKGDRAQTVVASAEFMHAVEHVR